MNNLPKILIKNHTKFAVNNLEIERVIGDFLKYIKFENDYYIEVIISGQGRIRTLNRIHRKIDKPTDVLSFPVSSPLEIRNSKLEIFSLGSIVICPHIASARDKAIAAITRERLNTKFHDEELSVIIYLVIHGLMHLLGYDHEKDNDYDRWEKTNNEFWLRFQGSK